MDSEILIALFFFSIGYAYFSLKKEIYQKKLLSPKENTRIKIEDKAYISKEHSLLLIKVDEVEYIVNCGNGSFSLYPHSGGKNLEIEKEVKEVING